MNKLDKLREEITNNLTGDETWQDWAEFCIMKCDEFAEEAFEAGRSSKPRGMLMPNEWKYETYKDYINGN